MEPLFLGKAQDLTRIAKASHSTFTIRQISNRLKEIHQVYVEILGWAMITNLTTVRILMEE
jgi:hypothetical protein